MRFAYFTAFLLLAAPAFAAPIGSFSTRALEAAADDFARAISNTLIQKTGKQYNIKVVEELIEAGSRMSLDDAMALVRKSRELTGNQAALAKVFHAASQGDDEAIKLLDYQIGRAKNTKAFMTGKAPDPGRQAAPIGSILFNAYEFGGIGKAFRGTKPAEAAAAGFIPTFSEKVTKVIGQVLPEKVSSRIGQVNLAGQTLPEKMSTLVGQTVPEKVSNLIGALKKKFPVKREDDDVLSTTESLEDLD